MNQGVINKEPPNNKVKRLSTDALTASMTVNTIPSKRFAIAISRGNAVIGERAVKENPWERTIGPMIPME